MSKRLYWDKRTRIKIATGNFPPSKKVRAHQLKPYDPGPERGPATGSQSGTNAPATPAVPNPTVRHQTPRDG
jgi:hypothetical protein